MKFQYNDGGRAAAGFTGKPKGECVVRAIAIATGKSYREVFDALNYLADEKFFDGSDSSHGVGREVYQYYLESIGWKWVPKMTIGSGCKVHLKSEELPAYPIVCRCSRHLVAVVNGVIQDIFDSSRNGTRCVYGWFELND